MKTSELFSDVMAILWDADMSESKEAVAIAAYVKTHRVNAENALEVINIMWPTATMQIRADGQGIEPGTIWFDVKFDDNSQAMVNANDGIGNSIELI